MICPHCGSPIEPEATEGTVLTVDGIDPATLFSERVVHELAERLRKAIGDNK